MLRNFHIRQIHERSTLMKENVHILLIEDDEDDCFFVQEMLEDIKEWHANLDWAPSVEEALNRINNHPYDIYLLDYNLGQYSGLDFIKMLPSSCTYAPVIMLTGERNHSRDMAAMEAGAMDYLVKGEFDAYQLERSIRYALMQKEIERNKDEFLATVNHELRTPVTSINGSLMMLLHGYEDQLTDEVRTMVDVAVRNCERLIRIVNDLLEAQQLQAGKMEILRAPLEISDIIKQAVDTNYGYAHNHNVSLVIAPDSESGFQIEGDKDRLLQVMANLISNAIKFTPKGGVVTVRAIQQNNTVRFEVTDQGPGIPEEFRPMIFGRFAQASKYGIEGTSGLGLNIAQSLVELHGGKIGFETETGVGSTFYFTLPVCDAVLN